MAIKIEDIVRVTIRGMPRSICLSPDLVWKPDGNDQPTFVKMAKAQSEVNRLLGQPLKAKGPNKRKLQCTSIIEDTNKQANATIEAEQKKREKKRYSMAIVERCGS